MVRVEKPALFHANVRSSFSEEPYVAGLGMVEGFKMTGSVEDNKLLVSCLVVMPNKARPLL